MCFPPRMDRKSRSFDPGWSTIVLVTRQAVVNPKLGKATELVLISGSYYRAGRSLEQRKQSIENASSFLGAACRAANLVQRLCSPHTLSCKSSSQAVRQMTTSCQKMVSLHCRGPGALPDQSPGFAWVCPADRGGFAFVQGNFRPFMVSPACCRTTHTSRTAARRSME